MFREWCSSQGFMTSTNLSHVLMDGGVLSVPYDRLNEFYRVYIQSVKIGEKIFVVEQKTDIYNFFLDIDYKSSEALCLEKIESITKVICDKVKSLGGGSCLVSVSKPKMQNDQVKSGVHLNWQDFPVDQKNAVNLRRHIVNTLMKIYPGEDWEKIIDSSVYGNPEKGTKGSGFRMPWSHKKGKHSECGGKGCLVCDNTGKLTEVAYIPLFMYNCNGPFALMERLDDTDPSVDILNAATIRTVEKASREIEGAEVRKKEGSFSREQTKNEYTNSEAIPLLETFIRGMRGHENVRVTKVFKDTKGGAYFVSTNSSYCENMGREHSSNHVWFLVNEHKIAQRCFCTCDIVRKRGFCKNFTGKEHELSPSIVNLLYPNKKSDKIKSAIAPNVSVHTGSRNRLCSVLVS
jgi:hypothetical protein